MSEQTSQEPTMEEILASIRRIISEDDAPADAAAPEAEAEPEPQPEPAPAVAAAPEPEPEPEPEDDVLELTDIAPEEIHATLGDLDISEPAPPAPAPIVVTPAPRVPEPVAYTEPTHLETDDGALLSSAAAAGVTSAFGSLSQRIGMPHTSTTLDGVVRELLRPLLKEWLNTNLRAIVEAKVEEEVERQSRRARG
jgi:cell pole-organizing protein PopZ